MSQPRGGERCPELQNLEPNIDGCDMMADNFDNYPWLQRDRMANTSTRVSRPEEEGVKRLVAMAGERDSGETCRLTL